MHNDTVLLSRAEVFYSYKIGKHRQLMLHRDRKGGGREVQGEKGVNERGVGQEINRYQHLLQGKL